MTKKEQKISRRESILQALASMLENDPGGRITTARLAREVGVSEAALYRHFPSKSKMFEGLIEFIEVVIFERVNIIVNENTDATTQLRSMVYLMLSFCERNPGMASILTGGALVGENEKLRARVVQFFDRFETQLKTIIRTAELKQGVRPVLTVSESANTLLSFTEGKVAQFVRSSYKRSPLENFDAQVDQLLTTFFRIPVL